MEEKLIQYMHKVVMPMFKLPMLLKWPGKFKEKRLTRCMLNVELPMFKPLMMKEVANLEILIHIMLWYQQVDEDGMVLRVCK